MLSWKSWKIKVETVLHNLYSSKNTCKTHILVYNSMCYRRFFDIIELISRFIIELQIKFLLMYFKC